MKHKQGFNSILVRLKVFQNSLTQMGKEKFQFHTGSIKSPEIPIQ